jgi:hypothetical protein
VPISQVVTPLTEESLPLCLESWLSLRMGTAIEMFQNLAYSFSFPSRVAAWFFSFRSPLALQAEENLLTFKTRSDFSQAI